MTTAVVDPGFHVQEYLQFDLTFEPHVAGGKLREYAAEINPYLHVHLTHGLSMTAQHKHGVLVIPPDVVEKAVRANSSIRVRLAVRFSRVKTKMSRLPAPALQMGLDMTGTTTLPASVHIAVHGYVDTATETGQTCRDHVGSSYVQLQQVLETKTVESAMWQFNGDKPLVKGLVRIANPALRHVAPEFGLAREYPAHELKLNFAKVTQAARFHIDSAGKEQVLSAEMDLLSQHIEQSFAPFNDGGKLATSEPSYLKPFHPQPYQNSTGVLPASAYVLVRSQEATTPDVFLEHLRVALARSGVSATRVLQAIAKQEQAVKRFGDAATLLPGYLFALRTCVQMLTVYPNTLVYEDDFFNEGGETLTLGDRKTTMHFVRASAQRKVSVGERFLSAQTTGGGDCEDTADAIDQMAAAFASLMSRVESVSQAGKRVSQADAEGRLLRKFGELLDTNLLVPHLNMAAVTNKKQQADIALLDQDSANGHTYSGFIATATFLAHLSDANPDGALVKAVRNTPFAQKYLQHARPFHRHIGVLVGEGTARQDPLVLPVSSYYAVSREEVAIARYAAGAAAKKALVAFEGFGASGATLEIPNRNVDDRSGKVAQGQRDVSAFYKANSLLFTRVFQEAGVLTFSYARDPEPADVLSDRATHGLLFNDYVKPEWDAQTRVVPFGQYSPAVSALVDDTLAQMEPIPPLRRHRVPPGLPVPAALRKLQSEFPQFTLPVDREPADQMPLPPNYITLSVRNEDATQANLTVLYNAVVANRTQFSGVQVRPFYLADAPTPGEESFVPAMIVYEVYLRLAE